MDTSFLVTILQFIFYDETDEFSLFPFIPSINLTLNCIFHWVQSYICLQNQSNVIAIRQIVNSKKFAKLSLKCGEFWLKSKMTCQDDWNILQSLN